MTLPTLSCAGHDYELHTLNDDPSSLVYSLRCTTAAVDASELTWPSDAAVSCLCGVKVRFVDGGDDLLEAIYRAEVGKVE